MGSTRDASQHQSDRDQEKILRRQLVTIRRKAPDVKGRNGQVINPEDTTFLLEICKELDRPLLRSVKDMPLPAHYVNCKDANGTTPLGFLCQKGDFVLVRMLCEMKGIDVNVQDSEGNTPLILASQAGHSSIVTFLLETYKNEIDLNRRNAFGYTALMKAALTGRLKCLKSLLSAGANVSLRDPSKGFTALEWAQFTGRKSCSEAIKNHLKITSSKNSKRLSQALVETEHWFKAKLNSGGGVGGTSPTKSDQASTTTTTNTGVNSILAKATGTSALLGVGSLSILQHVSGPDAEGNCGDQELQRPFVIPSIEITQV